MFSYGVNFATLKEAQEFAQAIDTAILDMKRKSIPPPPLVTKEMGSPTGLYPVSFVSIPSLFFIHFVLFFL